MAVAGSVCGGLLHDRTRPPGKPPTCAELVQAVLTCTLAPPPAGASHWTNQPMAQEVELDHTTVHRIWCQHGLAPHRCRQFTLSPDPNCARTARDVIGLHMDPPAHVLVLSLDEKTQTQARHRQQEFLPFWIIWLPTPRPTPLTRVSRTTVQ